MKLLKKLCEFVGNRKQVKELCFWLQLSF